MKIRSVRPEFFADPTMAELDPLARLLYIGLWCYVDDDGRGEWLPKQIDGQIFPLASVDIDALLTQLVSSARIVRYTDGDRDFFYIPTFAEYQKPNRKYDSKLPDPAECTELPGQTALTLSEQRVDTAHAHAVEGEGEGEGEGVLIAPKTALDAIKSTLVEIYGEPPKSNWSLYQRIATWIRDRGGTPDEVRYKAGRIVDEWGVKASTPASLEKHWTRYDAAVGQLTAADVDKYQADLRVLQRQRQALDMEQGLPG